MKTILAFAIIVLLLFVVGCSEISDLTQTAEDIVARKGFEILREVELESEWKVSQMRIGIDEGKEFSVLFKLADGDKVDGYFYLEEGDDVDFIIEGTSLIYQSGSENNEEEGTINSDRFSISASQAQGTSYTLTFNNHPNGDEIEDSIKIFLEFIYPVQSYTYLPIEAW